MSPRPRSRSPSRPPTTSPPADARSLAVIVGWGVAVLALVWTTRHPFVGVAAVACLVAAGVGCRYVVRTLPRPVEWQLSLHVPLVDCRVDVVLARPATGK